MSLKDMFETVTYAGAEDLPRDHHGLPVVIDDEDDDARFAADVSGEARDESGKWTSGGSIEGPKDHRSKKYVSSMSLAEAIESFREPDNAFAINEALRSGSSLKDIQDDFGSGDDDTYYQDIHDSLLGAVKDSVVREDMKVYRGSTQPATQQVGKRETVPSWSSMSTDEDIAGHFAQHDMNDDDDDGVPTIFDLKLPQGSHAIDTKHSDVKEVILPPGMTYIPTKIESGAGIRRIKGRIIPESTNPDKGKSSAMRLTSWDEPVIPKYASDEIDSRFALWDEPVYSFKEDEARDESGKWTAEPGSGGGKSEPSESSPDEDYQKHIETVESKIGAEIKAGHTTQETETVGGQGVIYKPERRKQHDEIIDEIWKEADADNLPREGKAVISGGLGGAGKSTVLGKYANIDSSKWLTINPDDIKEKMAEKGMIPEIEGCSPMEAAPLVHEESSDIAAQLTHRALLDKVNVIHDITMSSRGSVEKRIKALRAAGYDDIGGVFVDIPVETSVQRALGRHRRGFEKYQQGEGYGGRYVPPSLIRKAKDPDTGSSKNRGVFDGLQHHFDEYGTWDNSGKSPTQVAGTGRWAMS